MERCFECHSSASKKIGGNLLLDSRAGGMRGGDLGPAIVPRIPDQSLLINAVRRTSEEVQMPPDEPLSDREIGILVQWVKLGAPDPRTEGHPAVQAAEFDVDQAKDFWTFKSPHD